MGTALTTTAAALALATLPVAGFATAGIAFAHDRGDHSRTHVSESTRAKSQNSRHSRHRHPGHGRHHSDRNHLNAGTYMIECADDQLREVPRSFVVTCADAKEYLNKLTWKGWGHDQARAKGVLTIEPTYAEKQAGTTRTANYPVTVVADKLVKREANQVYSRMKVTFTGKKAPGEPRTMLVELPR
ncbi:MAG: hypothetical protein Q4G51_08290 [Dermatophilus congolensis]|nr:hypothetical protein [Dermatophilus congolensis]